jgi:hypothetical protein
VEGIGSAAGRSANPLADALHGRARLQQGQSHAPASAPHSMDTGDIGAGMGSDREQKNQGAAMDAPTYKTWWAHQDSNLEPKDYESSALTVEL